MYCIQTKILFIISVSSTIFFSSCYNNFEFTGTHGHIENYFFKNTNEEIVSKVDIFLRNNPEYYDGVLEDFGWVFIKVPNTNQRFGFEISGNSNIQLIEAGETNQVLKYNRDLTEKEREKYINTFETNFISKLEEIVPNIETVLKSPFILKSNLDFDSTNSPYYLLSYDTLISYPLPKEFNKIDKSYFEDLVFICSKRILDNKKFWINQHKEIFRINKEYSGYIKDNIYITKYYRDIGSTKKLKTIFDTKEWKELTKDSYEDTRLKLYKDYRKEKTQNKYAETDVYSDYGIERWMENYLK
jgi:hypothetical protein